MIYALVTTGEDGTYIADNFVTRDVLPDVKMWPWTYGTLGIILNSCTIDFPFTLEGQNNIQQSAFDLNTAWIHTINDFEMNNITEGFDFDPLAQSELAIQEIITNPKKMMFGQYLQANSAKLLHQTLDDENMPMNKRLSLITDLLKKSTEYLTCNYKMLTN